MPATIKLPTPFRRHTGQHKAFVTDAESVFDALEELVEAHPALRDAMFDEGGELKSFVRIFVDGRDIEDLGGLTAPLGDDADISIVPPVAGA